MPPKFEDFFSEASLLSLFEEKLRGNRSVGSDGQSASQLAKTIDSEIKGISERILHERYSFTRYKQKLILKGANSLPREIAIPTIRDALVLRALCDYLHTFVPNCITRPPHEYVAEAFRSAQLYSGEAFIRMDIKDFYPSICHDILMAKLSARIADSRVLALVRGAIRQTTSNDFCGARGVPQGLSISNALANAYFFDEDNLFFPARIALRYVDDVLLITPGKHAETLLKLVASRLRTRLRLQSHELSTVADGKTTIQPVEKGVNYLGFIVSSSHVSVREASVQKMMTSIASILTSGSFRGTQERLVWRLNLRITGCVFHQKSVGWVFFFRQLTDMAVLHRLDHFVRTELRRRGLHHLETRVKSFVKGHREIRFNRAATSYVPDFDHFTLADMIHTVALIRGIDAKQVAEGMRADIEREFYRLIRKEAEHLERETVQFGTS